MDSTEDSATDLVSRSLVIQTFASLPTRRIRITDRSPDLTAEETEGRLVDQGLHLVGDKRVHIVASNYGVYDDYAIDGVVSVVKAINSNVALA